MVMNNRKIVIYNTPNNCVQFEFIPKGSLNANQASACYMQMACYSGDSINWTNSVKIELTMTMLIDMIAILHQLDGNRFYQNIGKNQNKHLKFGVSKSERYQNGLWIEINEKIGQDFKLSKPRIYVSASGRLGDLISLKAFMIGALNSLLQEQTGMTYSVSEILRDLLNTSIISSLQQD
jgi:hypothetical protein